MAFKLPDFASVGFDDPRAVGGLPSFPANDPGSEGLAVLGKGVQAAGNAALDVAAARQHKQNQVNVAFADANLDGDLIRFSEEVKHERDPVKLDEMKSQLAGYLPRSGATIIDPDARQLWTLKHKKKIDAATEVVNAQHRKVYNDRFLAGASQQLDEQARLAAQASDPEMREQAKRNIGNILGSLESSGAIDAAKGQALAQGYGEKVIIGTVNWLDANGDAVGASRYLRENLRHIDPDKAEGLTRHLRPMVDREVGRAAKERHRTGAGGISVGGAVPSRIADEAGRQNFDARDALATAQIESSMGRNLGSRGNIFQLGTPERASVGGMGSDVDSQVRGGITFLARTRDQLQEALGRPPTGAEVYLGHQQGVAGATKLLANPDAPAGSLVPPEHIRANGGDPNAPASAFTGKWRSTFNRTADGITPPGAAPEAPPAAPPAAFDHGAGDSITAQQINHGMPGSVADFKTGADLPGTARVGAPPSEVLRRITDEVAANPKAFSGVNFLSSGASNNPNHAGFVGDQIDALKKGGATAVVVPGVGPGVKNADAVNASLKSVVEEHGGIFFQPQVRWQKDGIHPAEVDKVRDQGLAALAQKTAGSAQPTPVPTVTSAPGGTNGIVPVGARAQPVPAVPAAPAATPGVPDVRAWVDRIKADTTLTEEQKDIAIREVQQDQQQAMLGHAQAESDLTLAIARGEKGRPDIEDAYRAQRISPEKRTSLNHAIDVIEEKQNAIAQAVAKVSAAGAGGAPLDPKSKDDRAGLNFHYDAVSKAWPAEEVVDRGLAYSAQYGMVPTALQARIRGGLHSGRPELAIEAARTVNRLRNANPQLVGEIGDENDLRLANLISTYDGAGSAPERALQLAVDGLKVPKAERDARADDFDAQRGKTAVERHTADTAWLLKQNDTWGRDPNVDPLMRSEFVSVAKAEFEKTGNIEASRRMALDNINRVWGRSSVGGSLRYMKDAPEKFYGAPALSQTENAAWMNEQLAADVAKGALVDPGNPITPDRIKLLVDPTRAQGGSPVYQVWLAAPDGSWQQVIKPDGNPIAWKPDWATSADFKRRQDEKQRMIDVARGLRSPAPAEEKFRGTDAGRLLEEVR